MFIDEFFSVVMCPSLSTRYWRCFTVDQLLKEGDKLYLNALGNGEIPNTETISLNCLPNRIYWPFSSSLGNEVRTSSVNSLIMSGCHLAPPKPG